MMHMIASHSQGPEKTECLSVKLPLLIAATSFNTKVDFPCQEEPIQCTTAGI